MSADAAIVARAIDDARALLDTLLLNQWEEAYVESGGAEIFIALPGGRANPLHAGTHRSPALPAAGQRPLTHVAAPHVATLVDAIAIGTHVAAGACVARLRVLDDITELAAPVAGAIIAHHCAPGDLLEFGVPVVDLS